MRFQTFFPTQSSLSDVTVVAFLIFPAKTNNFNVESLRGHALTKQLRDTIQQVQQEVGKRMYETCLVWVEWDEKLKKGLKGRSDLTWKV